MAGNYNVLLIDDDIELTELISAYLSSNGFTVKCLHHGENVLEAVDEFRPDVIILDLMLPGIDGLTICKNIRPDFHGAIIMLTALGDDIDEVTGLEVGADDYLAKPVKPRVLLAHIRSQLRRQSTIQQTSQENGIFCYGQQIKLDATKRTVTNNNQQVQLSSAEFDLLWLLAKNVGTIIKREELHQQIFRLPYDGIDRSIDLRISRIRKKLNDDPKEPQIIKTVRNVGYLLAL
ncbi:response regulator [Thalassomonas haliotis]|uniref:Response regulator n=1 Tax=Thalassomonas haliotis TaxID=485448 RepID=A0ABY7VGZ6_9GAMM|nr:response regulator [Thalassomonas haliotis]WDE12977.1 response regulator [Thalassomonas haliotis]